MSEPIEPNEHTDKTTPAHPSGGLRWMKYLVVLVAGGLLVGLVIMGVANSRYSARKTRFANDLKQIGLAAGNFHDTYGHFPPLPADGSENPEVTEPVSFHTVSLPFIEAGDLYGRIDMTIPWDAPANRDVYEQDLPFFLSPFYERAEAPEGYGVTFIVPNSRLMPDGVGMAIEDITDGIGNTILAGGIDDTVVPAWGDPENDRDPAHGFAGGANAFGGLPKGGAQIVFADGHVEEFSPNTNPEIAKALATPAGGEQLEGE